jgi:hypothetical protein
MVSSIHLSRYNTTKPKQNRRVGPLGYEAKHVVSLGTPAPTPPFYAAIVARGGGGKAEDEAEFEKVVDPFATGGVEDEEGEDGGAADSSKAAAIAADPSLAKSGERLTDFTTPKSEYLGAPDVPALWAGGHRIWVLGGAPFRLRSEVPLKPYERGSALLLFHKGPRGPRPPPRPTPHHHEPWRGRGPPPGTTPGPTPEEEDWEDPYRDYPYLVVGTAKLRAKGEDVPTQGRIVAYRVEADRRGARLVQVDEASQRSGPPTALAQLGDRIIAACGPTLWVFSFVKERLRPIAFYDAE